MVALLVTPALSAWAWHRQTEQAPPSPPEPRLTHRLPVEIIADDTAPKWVLVPIDPS